MDPHGQVESTWQLYLGIKNPASSLHYLLQLAEDVISNEITVLQQTLVVNDNKLRSAIAEWTSLRSVCH